MFIYFLSLLLFYILECVSAFHGMFYLKYKHCRTVALLILHRPNVLLFVFVYKCNTYTLVKH
jgi:hypothetical protein